MTVLLVTANNDQYYFGVEEIVSEHSDLSPDQVEIEKAEIDFETEENKQ